jgi:hypothetical protein
MLMKNSRAQFKLAVLRYCREHENMMRCDGYACSLALKDYYKFWFAIKKGNNGESTKYASSIAGCTGDSAITDMWMAHFKHLYNSVNDQVTRDLLYERIESLSSLVNYTFSVKDIVEACAVQKQGKSVGSNGIAIETYIHGGSRLHIHIAFLFNLFAGYSYVSSHFMKPFSCTTCQMYLVSDLLPLLRLHGTILQHVNNFK